MQPERAPEHAAEADLSNFPYAPHTRMHPQLRCFCDVNAKHLDQFITLLGTDHPEYAVLLPTRGGRAPYARFLSLADQWAGMAAPTPRLRPPAGKPGTTQSA